MTTGDPVIALLNEEFLAAGFVRRKKSWYLKATDATVFAELQSSQWGEVRYLNLAAWVNRLGANDWPREDQAHLRTRLSALGGPSVDAILGSAGPDARTAEELLELRKLIREIAVPTLVAWSSMDGLRGAFQRGALSKALMDQRLKALLT